eukprot:TRINITY_DN9442_c0_g1_i1.p1 TRINITY_DN9442_c0_g1~~TRINITY_DN9442_c0_g1_i1.p1  ORF type:complete len:745 (+),score=121.08 TRINITY_DN9442_c0_g1_i1:72-2306(+)
MEIGISPDVKDDIDVTIIPELNLYRINGPLEVVQWLRKYGGSCVGEVSALEPLSIPSSDRVELGIPLSAEYMSFLYPPYIPGAKLCTSIAHNLLAYGGFAYFDAPDKRISRSRLTVDCPHLTHVTEQHVDPLRCVQINACMINPGEHNKLVLDGPYELPASLRNQIFEECLLHPACESLIDRRTRYVTWMSTKDEIPNCAHGILCYIESDDKDCEIVHYRLVHTSESKDVGVAGILASPTRHSRFASTTESERKQSGGYNILAVLGKGSFATVYSAVHLTTGEMVALKVIKTRADKALIQQTMNEHSILKSLCHRNLVKIHAFEIYPNSVHLIMDYVEGTNLKNLIANTWQGKVPLTILVRLLMEIIQAVGYLHSKEIIHRDLKPANVMCTSRGGVKVVDFGTAYQLSVDDSELTWQGTPAYSSPESLQGTVAKPQDVWAIGCIALEMATGTQPWYHLGNVHRARLLKMIIQSDHPVPEDLLSEVKDFINTCLDKEPSRRPECSALLTHPLFVTDDEKLVALDESSGRRRSQVGDIIHADSESLHGDGTSSELIETTSFLGAQNLTKKLPSIHGRSFFGVRSRIFGETHSSFGCPTPSPRHSPNSRSFRIETSDQQSTQAVGQSQKSHKLHPPLPQRQQPKQHPHHQQQHQTEEQQEHKESHDQHQLPATIEVNGINQIPTMGSTSSNISYMKDVNLPKFMDAVVRRVLTDRPENLRGIAKCITLMCSEMSQNEASFNGVPPDG